jgi:gas vesicle protein
MKTTNVMIALAAAAVAGAAIGMLLAPEKGTDLQKKLRGEADKWIDEVKKFLNTSRELKRNAEEEFEEIKSNLKPIED